MTESKPRNIYLALGLTLLAGIIFAMATGCAPASAGEVSIMERSTTQYQLQTVQDAPTVQYQTRSRTIAVPRQVTETRAVERTVMVPQKVTELQTRTRTECVECEITETVAVAVQSAPRVVRLAVEQPQTVAIGLRANEGPLSRAMDFVGRLRR